MTTPNSQSATRRGATDDGYWGNQSNEDPASSVWPGVVALRAQKQSFGVDPRERQSSSARFALHVAERAGTSQTLPKSGSQSMSGAR